MPATRTEAQSLPLHHWNLAPGSIDAAWSAMARHPQPKLRSRAGLVVWVGPYAEEGRLFAGLTGRESCEAADSAHIERLVASSGKRSITVVAETGAIDYALFGNLLKTRKGSAKIASVGFILGYDRTTVRWSVLKALWLPQREQTTRPLFVFGCEHEITLPLYEETEVRWLPEIDPGKLETLLQTPRSVAVLLSHSNGVDGNFGKVILCPNEFPDASSSRCRGREGLPSCAQSELCQRDPGGTRRRLHPHLCRSDIVLYDTCAGILFNDAFSSARHALGAGFITGCPAATITSIRKKASTPITAIIFSALLADGYSLGEIASTLNDFQWVYFGELPSFVVLGDPDFCHARQPAEVIVARSADQEMVAPWKGRVAKLTQVPEKSVAVPLDRNVLCVRDSRVATHRWLYRNPGASGPVRIRFAPAPEFPLAHDRLESAVALLESLLVGLREVVSPPNLQPLRDITEKSRSMLPALNLVRARFGCAAVCRDEFEAIERHQEEFAEEVRRLSSQLPAAWQSTQQWLVLHHYYSHNHPACGPETIEQQPCPICGNAVARRESQHVSTGAVRQLRTCIRCGVIGDLPEGLTLVDFAGPDFCAVGESAEFVLRMRITEEPLARCVQPYFAGFGAAVFKGTITMPELIESGDGMWTTRFVLKPAPDCPGALLSLVVAGAVDLHLFTAAKYVTVAPAVRLPP